jgi:hypothetical protein
MSIAVSDVESRVRKITRRDNTTDLSQADLQALILEACIEISQRLLCLKSSATGSISADAEYITAPADMVKSDAAIIELYLGSTLQDRITFAEWRAGKMNGFCYYEGCIYITPASDNSRDYTLYYATVHGSLSTNLEFNDDLKMAVVWLTCKKVFDNYFADSNNQSGKAELEYEREIFHNAPLEAVATRMRKTRE